MFSDTCQITREITYLNGRELFSQHSYYFSDFMRFLGMFSPKKRKVVAMHNATLLKIDLIRGIESEEPTTSQHVSRLMANEDKLHKESELPDFAAVLRDNIDVLTTNQV
jgi:hypothetical protein